MSDKVFLEKRNAWLELKKTLDDLLEEIDLRTAAHLRQEGDPPTRKMMEEADNLLAEVSQARGEVDMLVVELAI